MNRTLAAGAAILGLLALSGPAHAAYGDGFGLTAGTGAALPGPHSFWAGTCDTATAPSTGASIPGGVGTMPDQLRVHPAQQSAYVNPAGPFSTEPILVPAPPRPGQCIDVGTPVQGLPAWWDSPAGGPVEGAPGWRLPAATDAGEHPDGSATFTFERPAGTLNVAGSPDNIVVDLPTGFGGDTTAVPKCTAEEFAVEPPLCPPQTQVGISNIVLRNPVSGGLNSLLYPIYNVEPRSGKTAELGIPSVSDSTSVRIVAKARTNGDFGVRTFVPQIPAALDLYNQTITLWGVPWAAAHDAWRIRSGLFKGTVEPVRMPHSGLAPEDRVPYQASWGPIRPFLSNPTECSGSELNTRLTTDSFIHPGAFTADGDPDTTDPDWKVYDSAAPAITGCAQPPFDPSATFRFTSTDADSASGLAVSIAVPQNDTPPPAVASDPSDAAGAPGHWRSPAGRATAQLDKTVVTLPEGVSVNPSSAAGLRGCTDAQMGVTAVGNPYVFDNAEPACPDGSRIGTVEATTPVLDGSPNLTGEVVLGTPKSTDPTSGEMLRLFLVLRNEERGLLAKIHGTSVADPVTGRLTATFDENPRVPVESIELRLKGGSRGVLAMPQSCGEKSTSSQFTPWSAAHGGGGVARDLVDSFTVGGSCSLGFAPKLDAGMSTQKARGTGVFSFRFSREDGEQWINGLTATLPPGLLASVKGVPLCRSAEAAAGACPAGSRIGMVDATAGSGTPFVLERKGSAYLTEGYKGCAYGLAVVVPVVAGPFDASSPATDLGSIVVRQRVCVDPVDAHVTVTSDELPTIWHGIPLRVRSVTVSVDRDRFMLNPSGCAPKQVAADFGSNRGASSRATVAFRASGCAALPFKPKLKLTLTGRKQTRTGKHPGVKARVVQAGTGEAGIRRAEVRLPKSLALDPANAQALCEFEDGTREDVEKRCPKGSIVGRASATSPLLDRRLAGNVYFVKNIRVDRKTGNRIRTLPMIVVALRGEIAINLKGESSTTRGGRLVNTFAAVPDAPVSQFNLNVKGGRNGILTVTRTRRARIDLCRGRHVAAADMDGHNGRRYDRNVRVKTPCRSASKRNATRKNGKAKAKRRAAGRRR